jgi:hypothetical protein
VQRRLQDLDREGWLPFVHHSCQDGDQTSLSSHTEPFFTLSVKSFAAYFNAAFAVEYGAKNSISLDGNVQIFWSVLLWDPNSQFFMILGPIQLALLDL